MRIHVLVALSLWAIVMLLGACASRPAGVPLPPEATLAVAGFHQPRHGWEMLAGSRSEPIAAAPEELSPDLMEELNVMLAGLLQGDGVRTLLGPDATRQCQELALSRTGVERGGVSGLRYWLEVGGCTQADYLLVPQVLAWQEREGGEWGVSEPGMVVLELTLVDVQNQRIAKRFQYDEQQRSLSEDLLQAGRFFRRGGKWLLTKELVRDGLMEGIREMGL